MDSDIDISGVLRAVTAEVQGADPEQGLYSPADLPWRVHALAKKAKAVPDLIGVIEMLLACPDLYPDDAKEAMAVLERVR
jgi:hypothetical protein